MGCFGCRNCKHLLRIITPGITLASGVITINVGATALVDGYRYCLRLDQQFPASVVGTETVQIVNNTTAIQLTDFRARRVISERILHINERLVFQYTANSVGDTPIFRVLEGIVPLP